LSRLLLAHLQQLGVENGLLDGSTAPALVSFDDFEVVTRDWDEHTFHTSRTHAFSVVKEKLDDPTVGVLIVDDIMPLRSMRKHLNALAKAASAAYMVVTLMGSSLEELQRRNQTRSDSNRVSTQSLARVAAAFESPRAGNGFESHHVALDSSKRQSQSQSQAAVGPLLAQSGAWLSAIETCARRAVSAFAGAQLASQQSTLLEGHQQADRQASLRSRLHALDQRLRRASSQALTQLCRGDRAVLGPLLSARKAELTSSVRARCPAGFIEALEEPAWETFVQEREADLLLVCAERGVGYIGDVGKCP
jgi:tRNA uridine 5-carbamoylmethylation protein Kti12